MKQNQTLLLVLLGVLLIGVLWFLFLFKPASDELAEVNAEITAAQDQQSQLNSQLAGLRSIRQDVTSIEATLAAYETLVTPDPGLPSLLRQLQLSADESGMDLVRVSPGEPLAVEEIEDILSISVAIEVNGSYFQLVDFLRRLEDPALVGRAILIDGLLAELPDGEYPTLSVGITARVFTSGEIGVIADEPDAASPSPNPTATPSPGATEGATETESPAALAPTEVAS